MGRERVEEDEDEGWRCLNEGDGGGGCDAAGQRSFDRSKVRILLCDNDPKSSQEVFQLLLKCSYQGGIFSLPKKTELKFAGSSAFLTYVKSSASSRMPRIDVDVNSAPSEPSNREESSLAVGDTAQCNSKLVLESYVGGNGTPTSENICNMKDFQTPPEFPTLCGSSTEQKPQLRNEVLSDRSGNPPIFSLPFYYPGVMDQNILCSHGQMFQGRLNDVQAHAAPALLPHYSVVPHMPLIPSFPYQTFGINLQSGHVAAPNLSSSMTTSSVLEVKSGRIEKRAAALVKFRQKRKDRCFDKKIRYVNRKRLAEKRPRVRGQFVKQVNNVDLNQNVLGGGDGEFGDYEDDEPTSKELELISSPEQNASDC
ncbi:hypothetical protein GW17_00028180 [Ensete ventricosum]|nr:hypothetical protein GW17_00028180 [Ensete ventricosum]RZR94888.1 hypothetical protein BHM03_00023654 [Ensete ventricosum]